MSTFSALEVAQCRNMFHIFAGKEPVLNTKALQHACFQFGITLSAQACEDAIASCVKLRIKFYSKGKHAKQASKGGAYQRAIRQGLLFHEYLDFLQDRLSVVGSESDAVKLAFERMVTQERTTLMASKYPDGLQRSELRDMLSRNFTLPEDLRLTKEEIEMVINDLFEGQVESSATLESDLAMTNEEGEGKDAVKRGGITTQRFANVILHGYGDNVKGRAAVNAQRTRRAPDHGNITLRVVRVTGLEHYSCAKLRDGGIALDSFDPSLTVTLAGQSVSSPILADTTSPSWRDTLEIPFALPSKNAVDVQRFIEGSKLQFDMYDYQPVGPVPHAEWACGGYLPLICALRSSDTPAIFTVELCPAHPVPSKRRVLLDVEIQCDVTATHPLVERFQSVEEIWANVTLNQKALLGQRVLLRQGGDSVYRASLLSDFEKQFRDGELNVSAVVQSSSTSGNNSTRSSTSESPSPHANNNTTTGIASPEQQQELSASSASSFESKRFLKSKESVIHREAAETLLSHVSDVFSSVKARFRRRFFSFLTVDENNAFRLCMQSVSVLQLPDPCQRGMTKREGVWDDVSIAAQFARIPVVDVSQYPLLANATEGAHPLSLAGRDNRKNNNAAGGVDASPDAHRHHHHHHSSMRGDHEGLQCLSPYTMIARQQGTERDHAHALCSAFLGLRMNAYVVQGQDRFGGNRHWVAVIDSNNKPRLWQPTTGQAFIISSLSFRLIPSRKTVSTFTDDGLPTAWGNESIHVTPSASPVPSSTSSSKQASEQLMRDIVAEDDELRLEETLWKHHHRNHRVNAAQEDIGESGSSFIAFVGAVYNHRNIWLNTQKHDNIEATTWDLSMASDWARLFDINEASSSHHKQVIARSWYPASQLVNELTNPQWLFNSDTELDSESEEEDEGGVDGKTTTTTTTTNRKEQESPFRAMNVASQGQQIGRPMQTASDNNNSNNKNKKNSTTRPSHPSFDLPASNRLTKQLVKGIQDFRKFVLLIPETLFHGKLSLALDRSMVKADLESHVTARQWRARFLVHSIYDAATAADEGKELLGKSMPMMSSKTTGNRSPGSLTTPRQPPQNIASRGLSRTSGLATTESSKKLNLAFIVQQKLQNDSLRHQHRHFDRYLYLMEANPCRLDGRIQNIVPDRMLWHGKLFHFLTKDASLIMAQLQRTGILNSSALNTSFAIAVRVYKYDWNICSVWVHVAYMYDVESNMPHDEFI